MNWSIDLISKFIYLLSKLKSTIHSTVQILVYSTNSGHNKQSNHKGKNYILADNINATHRHVVNTTLKIELIVKGSIAK